MNSVTQCAQTVQRILAEEAEQLAREVGFLKRERVLSGADFVQSLILGWLQGSKKPWRILCEVYAKLAAMVIQLGCWQEPHRSLFKAAQVVRREANRLMVALYKGGLEEDLRDILRCMRSGCRLNTRQTCPNTSQFLLGTPLVWPQRLPARKAKAFTSCLWGPVSRAHCRLIGPYTPFISVLFFSHPHGILIASKQCCFAHTNSTLPLPHLTHLIANEKHPSTDFPFRTTHSGETALSLPDRSC